MRIYSLHIYRIILPFVALLYSLTTVGCSDKAALESVEQVLATAEEQIYERPDSSLTLLNTIDFERLSRKQRPAYALLLSQAKDKCYIDEVDDSLINIAVKYYSTDKDVERRFLAYYYQGRVYANGGKYAKAMLSYMLAEELIPQITNPYNIALLYAQMGNLYILQYDYAKSLVTFKKAYEYYGYSDAYMQQTYILFDIARTYLVLNNYEEAERYYNTTLQLAMDNKYDDLYLSCIEHLAILYEYKNDTNALKELLNNVDNINFNNSIYLLQSKAYLSACYGNNSEYEEYMAHAWTLPQDIQDTISLCLKEYKGNKALGLYNDALYWHEKFANIQDSIARYIVEQPLLMAQKEYLQSQAQYNELKLKHNRNIQVYLCIIFCLIICIISIIVRRYIVAKNNKIQQYLELIQDLNDSLFARSNIINTMSIHIKELFAAKFAHIDLLSNTYYDTHKAKRDKEEIYTLVKGEIEKLRTDKKYIQQLESIVNHYNNNLMQVTRDTLPQLSEMDFRLLCFIYSGFSAKAISVFTGDSVGNIYMKKSRLKTKIMQSESPNKEFILENL